MATVYSKTEDGLRCKCTYSVSSSNTSTTISGTIYLQHKGSADSFLLDYSGGLEKKSTYINTTIAETASIDSVSKHTDWTTIKSKSFSHTISKGTSSSTITFYVGIYAVGYLDDKTSFTITVPALTSYDVTYNANGGSGAPATQKKYDGKTLTLSEAKPSRSGYSFWHWNTSSSNSGTTYSPGGSYTSNSALSLYAIWNPVINYNANGGSGAPSSQTKTYGTNLTLSATVPTRSGYRFKNWNTKADGSGTTYSAGGTYSSNSTATLYAQWESYPKKPTISNMTAIRWDTVNDVQDDTSTSIKVSIDWAIDITSDVYGANNSGVVTLEATPQSVSTQPTITAVSGTTGTSGTAIFIVSNADTDMQYYITATVKDSYWTATGSDKTVIVTRAFFIMDFKAGGEAIGIGRAAPQSGLEVGYEATFDDDVSMLKNMYLGLDTSAQSGTTDGDLYAAITALGWDSEVIV